jgi:hypothetical protein
MPVELGEGAFWLLLAIGTLSGIASLWVFRRWSDAGQVRSAMNLVLAHLMEFQLFAGEPALIVRAQYDLLAANARFLRLVALPSLILALPMAALLMASAAIFGKSALPPDQPAVVTVHYDPHSSQAGMIRLESPAGLDIETDSVRVPRESQISWRIRPRSATSGELRVFEGGRAVTKKISAKPGLQWLSERRSNSLLGFLYSPSELPFSSSAIQFIELQYPSATVFRTHWLVWFCVGSLLGFCIPALITNRSKEFG